MSDDHDDEAVGYGRPPKARQFKKGQSGNPNGRPRKVRPDPALSAHERAANMTTTVTIQGQSMTLAYREAFDYALWGQAAKHVAWAVREVRRRRMRDQRLKELQEEDDHCGVLHIPHPPEDQALLDAYRANKQRVAQGATAQTHPHDKEDPDGAP